MSDLGEQQEVFTAPPPNELRNLPTVRPEAVDVEPFARAAAHLQMFEKLRDIAVQMTKPTDWHLFGDKPWPMRGAAEKIMRGLGLNLEIYREAGVPYTKRMAQDDLGGYYIITVSGKVKGPWGDLDAMGFCSSRDQFFAADGYDTEGNMQFKPLSQIKEEHLIQAAYTNFVANAVMRYTGLSGCTQEDLEKHYGVGKVSQHKYAESSKKKTVTDTAERSSQMKELAAICMVMSGGIESDAAMACEAMSAFTGKDGKPVPGKRSPKDLSDGRLNATLRTARKEWKAFVAKQGDQAGFYEDLLKQRLEGGKGGSDQG